MADFMHDGKHLEDRALLTISLIIGAMCGKIWHRKFDGIGSSVHEALEDFFMIAIISSPVVGVKVSNVTADGFNRD